MGDSDLVKDVFTWKWRLSVCNV